MSPEDTYALCAVFFNLYYVLAIIFFYRNKDLSSVTVRLPNFVGVCSFFGMVLFNLYLSYFFDHAYFATPGFVHLWIYYIFIPGWLYCNLLRDLYLFFLHFLNKSRMASSSDNGYTTSKMEISEKIMLKMALNLQKLVKRRVIAKSVKFLGSKSTGSSKKLSIIASNGTNSQEEVYSAGSPQVLIPVPEEEALTPTELGKNSERQIDISSLSAFNLQDLIKLVVIIVLFGILLSIIFTSVFPGFNSVSAPTNDQMNTMSFPLYAIIALYFIFKSFFIYNYRHINDIYGLRIEAYATFGCMSVGYILIVGGIGGLKTYAVMSVLLTVLHTLMNVFPVAYGYYDLSKLVATEMPEKDIASGVKVQDTTAQDLEKFKLILKDSALLYPFKQICSQAYCLESIIFIEQIDELNSMNIKVVADAPLNPTMKRKLEKIVNTFIVYGSSYEIKIDETLRQNLIVMYGKNNVKFMEDLGKAYDEICLNLVKDVFPRFKKMHPDLVRPLK